ncbi:hypothetical protein [Curtobacterium sp. MCPF17_052]|uniref:hypothetical protein n=1 Tax=Curtobacterium sp. MCPF17_052 TaxID=2175655 RepID=UPI0024DF6E51|nr:hypothetical protein [Curtobacterium sp. MCPF17_052]WIB11446.1 hypothetical protein DEJ36_10565 [Curtobacterium sp. MCPF17_052]
MNASVEWSTVNGFDVIVPVAPSPPVAPHDVRYPLPTHPDTWLCPAAVSVAPLNAVPVLVHPSGTPCSKSASSSSEGSTAGVTVPLTVTGDSNCIAVPSLFHFVGYVSFVPSWLLEDTNGYAHMSPEYLLTSRSVHHWLVGTGFPACDGSMYRCWSTVFCTSALSLIEVGGVGANDPEPTRVPSVGGAGTVAGGRQRGAGGRRGAGRCRSCRIGRPVGCAGTGRGSDDCGDHRHHHESGGDDGAGRGAASARSFRVASGHGPTVSARPHDVSR